MARSDDPEREIWGTWEELLLACAVGRHGTRRWESVAMEIQSRSPLPHLLTPQNCRQRYRDLQRRFSGPGVGEDDGGDADSTPEVPWLEELRKLRVAELRREVERYDLSIGSLQLKVKKLQEERERSIRESNSSDEKPDRAKEDSRPSESTPEKVAGDRISGRDSGPSCEESTSTGPKKDERSPPETVIGGKPADPAVVVGGGCEKASPAAREGSCDGSTEGGPPSDPASRPQSGESVAESSKGEAGGGEEQHKEEEDGGGCGNEGEKESSDVQSSASLSRQRQQRGRRWRKAVSGGSSSVGDEPEGDAEAEEVSGVCTRHAAAESGPLVSFLEIVRSDKHGSVFDRRLDSQEGEEYASMIRQHVDLEIVQSRIDRMGSGHPYEAAEFFRDLLLLCNNALVFFPRDAPESVAALHIRELVSKRMAAILPPQALSKAETTTALSTEPKSTASRPKLELDLPVSLLVKTASSTPLIVCRKRSAISNKAAAAAATSLKEEEIVEEEEDKPEPDKKFKDNEDKLQAKKTAKEKPVLSGTTRGLRTSKTRGGHGGGGAAGKRPGITPATNLKSKPVEVAVTAEASKKTDKKIVTPAAPATKKQNAAGFLNRMKKSTNGSTTASETAKNSSGKGSNQKKGGKGDNRKDKSSRQGSAASGGGGSTKKSEDTSGGKRSVGRPPKRSAPPLTPPPSKRAREDTEPAAAAATSRPPTSASRKRGRR